jgi:mannose-6-phosphate isomerase
LDAFDQHLLTLEPQYRERVWGGQTLRPANPPIGEGWIAYGRSRVTAGRFAGRTLDELAAAYGSALLGTAVAARFGAEIPILIKLLDCADWLSVQVHPDDEQARRMVGPNERGKAEAWYFVNAGSGADLMVGVKSGVTGDELAAAIREGRILEVANTITVHGGDAILIPAGTLHALGPGLFLYEIQEASDTTYRVYDWDRPASEGRKLHIEESVEVTRPVGPTELRHPIVPAGTGTAPAIECPYFELELVQVSPSDGPLQADTEGRRFHILTTIDGTARVTSGRESIELGPFATALVAGSAGAYEIQAIDRPVALLRAAVPD